MLGGAIDGGLTAFGVPNAALICVCLSKNIFVSSKPLDNTNAFTSAGFAPARAISTAAFPVDKTISSDNGTGIAFFIAVAAFSFAIRAGKSFSAILCL